MGKYKPQEKYDVANTKQIRLKLNLKTDKDIIEWLGQQDTMQGAIKRLIRADIENENRDE